MRIYGQPGVGRNTSKGRKLGKKPTAAEKRLAKRQASYDAMPVNHRKGKRRPGSLKKG